MWVKLLWPTFLHVLPAVSVGLKFVFTLCHVHAECFIGAIAKESGDIHAMLVQPILDATAKIDLHDSTGRHVKHLVQ